MNRVYVEERTEIYFAECHNAIEYAMVKSRPDWMLDEETNAPAHYSDRKKRKIRQPYEDSYVRESRNEMQMKLDDQRVKRKPTQIIADVRSIFEATNEDMNRRLEM